MNGAAARRDVDQHRAQVGRVRTPTTTVAIRRLEKVGLVKRSRDPSDLRAA
ncbi:hypothetical protein JHV675_54460 [Mycobacterium avium subsp. hominissuis]